MYKVIGADTKVYGPVSADTLREWIAQGRANGSTRVLPEGVTEWKTLSELPEFGATLTAAATPAVPATLYSGPAPRTNPLATTGLVMGILSVTVGFCCCYGFPFNVAGLICSGIALAQINKDPVNQQGKGIAMAGLITSILSIVLTVLLIILWGAVMTIPEAARRLHRL